MFLKIRQRTVYKLFFSLVYLRLYISQLIQAFIYELVTKRTCGKSVLDLRDLIMQRARHGTFSRTLCLHHDIFWYDEKWQLRFIHVLIHLYICLFINPCLFICLSIYQYIHSSVHVYSSTYPSIHLSIHHFLFIHPDIHSLHLFTNHILNLRP